MWAELDDERELDAADVIYQLSTARWRLKESAQEQDLVALFPNEIRRIASACLGEKGKVPSIFQTGAWHDEGRTRFMIQTLSRVGDVSTLPILRGFVDDPRFGRMAIEAIERINRAALVGST